MEKYIQEFLEAGIIRGEWSTREYVDGAIIRPMGGRESGRSLLKA